LHCTRAYVFGPAVFVRANTTLVLQCLFRYVFIIFKKGESNNLCTYVQYVSCTQTTHITAADLCTYSTSFAWNRSFLRTSAHAEFVFRLQPDQVRHHDGRGWTSKIPGQCHASPNIAQVTLFHLERRLSYINATRAHTKRSKPEAHSSSKPWPTQC
jgi:hypothetical protein